MTAVFESFNDTGIIQFSSDAFTYSFYEKITVTTNHQTQDIGPILGPAYYVYIGCVPSFFGIGFDGGGLDDFLVAYRSTTNTPVFARQNGEGIMFYSRSPATIDIYIFTRAKEIVNPNYSGEGLQLFDENGDISYDSRLPPMIPVRFDDNPSIANGASTTISGLASGRTYAWVNTGTLRRNGSAYTPDSPYNSYPWNNPITHPAVRYLSATSFAMEPVTQGTAASAPWWNPPAPDVGATAGGILTVDVTNLAASGITVSCSPNPVVISSSGATPNQQVVTTSVSGGTASAYEWEIGNENHPGNFTLSNQSGNTIKVTNGNPVLFPVPRATLRCFAWVNGIRRAASVDVYGGP